MSRKYPIQPREEVEAQLEVHDPRLPLVEMFSSIQGEGTNAGWPAFFVRWAGCNLNCHFADGAVCDTPWQKARIKPRLSEVVEAAKGHKLVILTGGEPTIATHFFPTVMALKSAGMKVAVETNGTHWNEGLKKVGWITVSPKAHVAHMEPHKSPRLNTKVMLRAHEIRVVVTPDFPDSILEIHQEYGKPGCRFLSPATIADGTGDLRFHGFAEGAVEKALELLAKYPRWRLGIQAHKVLGLQ